MSTSNNNQHNRRSKKKKDEKQKQEEEGIKVGMFGRRKWDEEVFARKAAERSERESSGFDTDEKRKSAIPASERKALQARSEDVSLDKHVGIRSEVDKDQTLQGRSAVRRVQGTTGGPQGVAGFYCELCDCVIKDSISYVDHLNSRTHISNMGMTMRAERATLEAVLKKLEEPPRRKIRSRGGKKSLSVDTDLENRIINEQMAVARKKQQLEAAKKALMDNDDDDK